MVPEPRGRLVAHANPSLPVPGLVLEHGHNLVKVSLNGGLLLVGGDPDGLKLGHLLLDGSIDLIKSGDSSKLLGDLLIVSSLLRMFTKL